MDLLSQLIIQVQDLHDHRAMSSPCLCSLNHGSLDVSGNSAFRDMWLPLDVFLQM